MRIPKPATFYLRPTRQWNRLARRYVAGTLLSYAVSPIIELGGHQYMQVDYMAPLAGDRYPEVPIYRSIVLCDGQSVVHDRATAERVTELAILSLVHRTTDCIYSMEQFSAHKSAVPWLDRPLDRTVWYKEHQSILGRYVPPHLLVSLVETFEFKQDALHRRAHEAARMLRVLHATVRGQPVPAEQLRAVDCLYLRTIAWDLQDTRLFLRDYYNDYPRWMTRDPWGITVYPDGTWHADWGPYSGRRR